MSDADLMAEVQRWLRFAREDLDAAAALLDTAAFVPRHVCWLAQQGAEKALKGALVSQGVQFPYRHDLDALRNLLPDGWEARSRYPDLAELTEWAVEARYPGDSPDAGVEDARRAATEARGVYEVIAAQLVRQGFELE